MCAMVTSNVGSIPIGNSSYCEPVGLGLPQAMQVNKISRDIVEIKPAESGSPAYVLGKALRGGFDRIHSLFQSFVEYMPNLHLLQGVSAAEIPNDKSSEQKKKMIKDASQACKITEMGSCNLDFSCRIAVSENFAYVSAPEALLIVDVSNPSKPILQGRFQYPVYTVCSDVSILKKGEVCIADREGGLQIVNTQNPSNPYLMGFYNSTPGFTVNAVKAVQRSVYFENRAYTIGNDDKFKEKPHFDVFNFTHPQMPIPDGKYVNFPCNVNNLDVFYQYAYVVHDKGLTILKLNKSPNSPSYVSQFPITGSGKPSGGVPLDVKVVSNTAFVLVGGFIKPGLWSIDVSNPANPIFKDRYEMRYANVLTISKNSKNHAFVIGQEYQILNIIDISNPSKLSLAGSYKMQNAENIGDVGVDEEGYAYIQVETDMNDFKFSVLKVDC